MPEDEAKDTSISLPAGDGSRPEDDTYSLDGAPDILPPEILAQIPLNVRKLLSVRLRKEITNGPLPPPSMLKEYEQLHPGCTKQLLSNWDNQTRHRQALECRGMSLEEKYLDSTIEDGRRGQWFAFILCMSIVVAGVFLAYLGYPWPGALLGGSGLASKETRHDDQDATTPKK